MAEARKPYVVDIEEHFHRGVIIYAKSVAEAEEIAKSLCDSGDIDMGRNCYAGRDTNAYAASDEDLEIYDIYDDSEE